MPYTVNGIGTCYGRKHNVQKILGRCEFCGRTAELLNYETSLCVCVLFIPLIPIAHKQVLNYCPTCRRHRVASAKQWRQITDKSIDAAAGELAQRPDDAQAAVKLLHTYIGIRQLNEAAELARVIHREFTTDANAQLAAAEALILASRPSEAEGCYRAALAVQPQNESARAGLSMMQIDARNATEAQRMLQSAPAIPVATNVGAYVSLGRGFHNESKHAEALEVFREALAAAPNLARDKALRKIIQKSERATGAEQSMLPAISLWKTPKFIWTAIAAVLLIAIFGGNWLISRSRTLHVVNGFPTIVRVKIDGGDELTVPPHGRRDISLGEGNHQAAYSIGAQAQQQTDFTMAGSFFERFWNSKIPLLNPGGGAALLWEQTQYSRAGGNGGGLKHEWFVGKDFAYSESADYEFEEFPSKIEVSDKSGSVTKSRIAEIVAKPANLIVSDLDVPVDAMMRYAESQLLAGPGGGRLAVRLFAIRFHASAIGSVPKVSGRRGRPPPIADRVASSLSIGFCLDERDDLAPQAIRCAARQGAEQCIAALPAWQD